MLNKKFSLKKIARTATISIASLALVAPLALGGFNAKPAHAYTVNNELRQLDNDGQYKKTEDAVAKSDIKDEENDMKQYPGEAAIKYDNPEIDGISIKKFDHDLVNKDVRKGILPENSKGHFDEKAYFNGHMGKNFHHAKKYARAHRTKRSARHIRKAKRTKRNHISKENRQSNDAKESNTQLRYALKQIKVTPTKTKRNVKYNRQAKNTKRGINDAINMRLTKRLKNNRQYRNGYMKVIRYWNKGGKLWTSNKAAYKSMIKNGTLAVAANC